MFDIFLYIEVWCYMYFLVFMYDIVRVKVFGGFEQLIYDVTFMYIFENVFFFYNIMQICFCNLFYNVINFFDNDMIRLMR